MPVKLYLDIEGVLLHRVVDERGRRRGFRLAPFALEFLSWAALGFDCRWLTRLDRRGGNYRIKRAFRLALGVPCIDNDLEILFECVKPTVWDDCMAEAIGLDSDFFWIAHDPDEESIAALARRRKSDRLIRCSTEMNADDFATIQVKLESLYEHGHWGLDDDMTFLG